MRPTLPPSRRTALTLCLIGAGALAACVAESDSFPAGTPPTDPGGGRDGGTRDAASHDAADANADAGVAREITGRLCLLSDLAAPTPCSPVARGGLTVRRLDTPGGAPDETITSATGTFTFEVEPGATSLLLTIDDPELELVAAAALLDVANPATPLPVLSQAALDDIRVASSVPVLTGPGHVVVLAQRDGAPAADLVVTALSGVLPAYDQGNGLVFQTFGDTGPTGVAVYFNAAADTTAPLPVISADLPGAGPDPQLAVPIVGDRTLVVRWTLPPPPESRAAR